MNEELQRRLTEALDERARDLDGATLSRLRQARAQAMAEASHRPRWLQPAWLSAAGLATLVMLAVLLLPRLPSGDGLDTLDLSGEALEIATLGVDLEVIEDLDFYEWLSEQNIDEAPEDGSA
jgi:hypothetical protein